MSRWQPRTGPSQWVYCVRGCKRRAWDGNTVCKMCLSVEEHTDQVERDIVEKQIVDALERIGGKQRFVHYPYRALRDLAGPPPCGHVIILGADSGKGKTTFIYNLVNNWLAAGVGVTVLPLEQKAADFRIGISAMRVGVPVDAVLGTDMFAEALAGDTDAEYWLTRLRADVASMEQNPLLYVEPDATMTSEGVERACILAKSRGHEVVIIDHMDHVSGEPGGGSVSSAFKAYDTILRCAKQYNLLLFCTSQLNNDAKKAAKDVLSRNLPPDVEDLKYPTKKTEIATQILTLFRPLNPGASKAELAGVRDGSLPPERVFLAGAVGVFAAKLRYRGVNTGKHALLKFDKGVIRDFSPAELEQQTAQAELQMIAAEQDRLERNRLREERRQRSLEKKYAEKRAPAPPPSPPSAMDDLPF